MADVPTKVLFLDIDGVLNSERSCLAFGDFPHDVEGPCRQKFDEVALRLIRGIVERADAGIVLSSSWRIIHHYGKVANGLDLPIFDRTPSLLGGRGEEIAAWLADHPEVETYAIVDDDADMLECQKPSFVQTNYRDGFTYTDAIKLAELFGVSLYDINRKKEIPNG